MNPFDKDSNHQRSEHEDYYYYGSSPSHFTMPVPIQMTHDQDQPLLSQSFNPTSHLNEYSIANFDGMPPSSFVQNDFNVQHEMELFNDDATSLLPSFDRGANVPLTDAQEQAILLLEPNFIRQQHFLQENQIKLEQVEQQDFDGQMRSNLSAMLDQSNVDPSLQHNTFHQLVDQHQFQQPPPSPGQPSSPFQPQPPSQAQSHSFGSTLSLQEDGKAKGKRKERRSQPPSRPIPINNSNVVNRPASSSVPTEIDHQRRFNELQARFRINYAKKQPVPKPKPSSSVSSIPSSFHPSSSVPVSLEKGHVDPDMLDTSRMEAKPKAKGIAIPNKPAPSPTPTTSHPPPLPPASFPSRTMPIQIQRVHRGSNAGPLDAEQQQKHLDDQLVKANFEDITVAELKEMLRRRGKPATGKKVVLLQRLLDEREHVKNIRSGIPLHHTQQASQSIPEPIRPRSFQGHPTSIPPQSPLLDTASLSSSPGSVTLARSIANMHIGSPPMTHARRFSPYGPASPRMTSASSPKLPNKQPAYSSSMPTGYLSSSPVRPTWQRQKSYAPFTSSALATPDRDVEEDPFDTLPSTSHSDPIAVPDNMDWSLSANMLDQLLQNQVDLPEGMSAEQLLSLIENSNLPADFTLPFQQDQPPQQSFQQNYDQHLFPSG